MPLQAFLFGDCCQWGESGEDQAGSSMELVVGGAEKKDIWLEVTFHLKTLIHISVVIYLFILAKGNSTPKGY